MTVLVACLPTPEGDAAAEAVEEAGRRSARLVVLNTPREGAPVSTAVADEGTVRGMVQLGEAAGVQVDVRQDAHAGDVADEVVRVAGAVDASVIVIGLRRRSPVGKLLRFRRRPGAARRPAARLVRRLGPAGAGQAPAAALARAGDRGGTVGRRGPAR